jgi:hypothetical protein
MDVGQSDGEQRRNSAKSFAVVSRKRIVAIGFN